MMSDTSIENKGALNGLSLEIASRKRCLRVGFIMQLSLEM